MVTSVEMTAAGAADVDVEALHPRAAAWWEAFWAAPQAARVTGAQRVVAVRAVLAYDSYFRWSEMVNACPLVEGSQGQPRPNPLAALLAAKAVELRDLERQLGIGLANLDALTVDVPGDAGDPVDELRARRAARAVGG